MYTFAKFAFLFILMFLLVPPKTATRRKDLTDGEREGKRERGRETVVNNLLKSDG